MAEKLVVKMESGEEVAFGAKQKLVKSTFIDDGTGDVCAKLQFKNGAVRLFVCPNEEMLKQLAMHGASQKLGDEIANVKEIDDCVLAAENLIGRLQAGEWTKERTSSGMGGTSVLILALIEHTGKDVDTIKAYLSDKTQAQKMALRNNPKVKPVVERIEAERAAAKAAKDPKSVIDTDALLAEIA